MNPHELFTTSGRLAGSGLLPAGSVGARIQSPHASSVNRLHVPAGHALQAIHRACGATPIWLAPPSLPTIVPIVCVPCPCVSHGARLGLPQLFDASNQL